MVGTERNRARKRCAVLLGGDHRSRVSGWRRACSSPPVRCSINSGASAQRRCKPVAGDYLARALTIIFRIFSFTWVRFADCFSVSLRLRMVST